MEILFIVGMSVVAGGVGVVGTLVAAHLYATLNSLRSGVTNISAELNAAVSDLADCKQKLGYLMQQPDVSDTFMKKMGADKRGAIAQIALDERLRQESLRDALDASQRNVALVQAILDLDLERGGG